MDNKITNIGGKITLTIEHIGDEFVIEPGYGGAKQVVSSVTDIGVVVNTLLTRKFIKDAGHGIAKESINPVGMPYGINGEKE